jgi:hypothetical protein
MQSLLFEIRRLVPGHAKTSGKYMANSKPGQRMTAMVQKDVRLRVQIQISLLTERSQHCGRLRPERTVALLSSLTKQPHLEGSSQLQIADAHVRDFLDATAGVEHHREQRVVSAPLWCGPLNGLENRVYLIVFQVINRPLCCALEWNPQDTLCEIEMLGVSRRYKTEKRVDGREPHVARGHAIIALPFEVRQEGKNRGWGQVGQVEHSSDINFSLL